MDTTSTSHAPMKIIATERLIPAYLEKLGRQNSLAAIVAMLIVAFSLFSLLFPIGENSNGAFISGMLCILASLIGASWAWTTAYRARRGALQLDSRYQLAWFLIGTGLLANGLGRTYVTYLSYNKQLIPAPSLADIGFTLFYPLLFAGLVLMLTGPRPGRACVKMGLDAAITTFCILGASWYFFIAPTLLIQRVTHTSTAALFTALSYPFWDMLLLLATLMILRRCAERTLHPSLLLCGAGLLTAILADTGYAHFTALGMYSSAMFVGPFRVMSVLLIGLSAHYQYAALARRGSTIGIHRHQIAASKARVSHNQHDQHDQDEISPRRFILLHGAYLYLPMSILLALTLGSEVINDEQRTLFLVVLTAIVGLFVAARYLLAMYENALLLRERERRRQEAEQLYMEVHAAHQRLQEVDQLKDQFMMTASHELRAPLTCVQGYLKLLTQFHEFIPPERYQDFLQKAERSCTELVVLLNNIMDASYLEVDGSIHSTHVEPVGAQDMIQSVTNLIEPQVMHERREVQLDIPPDVTVQADPVRLRQVLLNITVNALKYSPPRTPLTFSAQIMPGSEDEVVICVTDKGRGIAPEDQARLFQRFTRLESAINSPVQGSGLGLYISRRLIEGMGGKICIESSGIPGEGTTVHIQLPRSWKSAV